MRDRRSVDDLTIEELEQILRRKKRESRLERLRRYESDGRRRVDIPTPEDIPDLQTTTESPSEPPADPAAADCPGWQRLTTSAEALE